MADYLSDTLAKITVLQREFDELSAKLAELREQQKNAFVESSRLEHDQSLKLSQDSEKKKGIGRVFQKVTQQVVGNEDVYKQNLFRKQIEANTDLIMKIRDVEVKLESITSSLATELNVSMALVQDLAGKYTFDNGDILKEDVVIDESKLPETGPYRKTNNPFLNRAMARTLSVSTSSLVDTSGLERKLQSIQGHEASAFDDPVIGSVAVLIKDLQDRAEQEVLSARLYQSELDSKNNWLAQKGKLKYTDLSSVSDVRIMRTVKNNPDGTQEHSAILTRDYMIKSSEDGLSDDRYNFANNAASFSEAVIREENFIIPEERLRLQKKEEEIRLLEVMLNRESNPRTQVQMDELRMDILMKKINLQIEKEALQEEVDLVDGMKRDGVPLTRPEGRVEGGRFKIKEIFNKETGQLEAIEAISVDNTYETKKGKHTTITTGVGDHSVEKKITLAAHGLTGRITKAQEKGSWDGLKFGTKVTYDPNVDGKACISIETDSALMSGSSEVSREFNDWGQAFNIVVKINGDLARTQAKVIAEKNGKKTDIAEVYVKAGHVGAKLDTDIFHGGGASVEAAELKVGAKLGGKNLSIFSADRTDHGIGASIGLTGAKTFVTDHSEKAGFMSIKGSGNLKGEGFTLIQEKDGEKDFAVFSGLRGKNIEGMLDSICEHISPDTEIENLDDDRPWSELSDEDKTWEELDRHSDNEIERERDMYKLDGANFENAKFKDAAFEEIIQE